MKKKLTDNWIDSCVREYKRAGGHSGPRTIDVVRGLAEKYFQQGFTAKSAGIAAVDHVKLYSSMSGWRELAS